ncbi:helix-turn-helix transcriptional regulator [uncultured Succinivibrio sp.]|uniref:helix-turn-helix domain-containing protein n=1 Tax=uncultured Succinivibrio sp. TaxID=540749 RepID=UPI0025FD7E86|nr:helix-turn-helix transcriptional regulator [uncultured Succinivibrio sp.]
MPFSKLSDSKLLIKKLKSYSAEIPNNEEELGLLFMKAARSNLTCFSKRLKRARLEQGRSQVSVASLLNVRQATFSEWENGKYLPNLCHIRQLINIYGIDPAELIEDNPIRIIQDSLVPLLDEKYLTNTVNEVNYSIRTITGVQRIPVSHSEHQIAFAYRNPDSSMFGGSKPIFENSVLICSIRELLTRSESNLFLYCDNKICIVNVGFGAPLVRLLRYDNNVLSLIALNPKWPSYSFPDGKEYVKNLTDVKDCLYNGKELYSDSIQIVGIVKKMYVDF